MTRIITADVNFNEEINSHQFNCNNDGVNQFLWFNIQDNNYERARIHLLVPSDYKQNDIILGYVALKSTTLFIDEDDINLGSFPAIEIYQLGVNKDNRRQGYGCDLLSHVFGIAHYFNEAIAIKSIVVNSTDTAYGFYKHFEFKELSGTGQRALQDDTNRGCIPMYLNIEDI